MSIPFTNDDSIQLTYTSFPFTTTNFNGYTASNYVSNISNLLINNINTKQNILTAATNLLGVGSAITALDYNKITLNVPTTFLANMTNIYSKSETDTLSNTKQATLTAATTLLGIGGSITGINLLLSLILL